MKISDRALTVLKNFSSINQSIIIEPGNAIVTMSPQKTIMAKAVVDDTFDRTMCIYDLSQFLQVLSLFKQPELELETESVLIHDAQKKSRYFYADESLLLHPPTKELKVKDDISFFLPYQAISSILKATNILSVPEIAFVGEGGKLYIRSVDTKNASSNSLSHELGDTEAGEFTVIFKPEYLAKLFDADYDVVISSSKIAKFEAKNIVTYWIAVESNSTF